MEDTHESNVISSEPIESQSTPPNERKHRILLVGGTGVGKSSFISRTTGCDVKIGHSVVSCTTDCAHYDVSDSGKIFTLIDTPGLNDTSKDNLEILRTITDYLATGSEYPISGIIYLHRITDTRVCGSDLLNLQVLKALAGRRFYSRVVVASTMWDKIPNDEFRQVCQGREAALKGSKKYWLDMLEDGCKYFRFQNDRKSGLQILNHFLSIQSHDPPAIIKQLNEKKSFEETDAGGILVEDCRRREEAKLRELEEAKEEAAIALEESKRQVIAQKNVHAISTSSRHGRHGREADRNAHYHSHQGLPGPEDDKTYKSRKKEKK